MKKILIIFFVLFCNECFAYKYNGVVEDINSSITIKYSNFNGTVSGSNKIITNFNGSKDTQVIEANLTSKKIGNNLEIEYFFAKLGFKIIVLIAPNGKIKNYSAKVKENNKWIAYSKTEIKKQGFENVISKVLDAIIYDYSNSFVKGDTVVRYKFREMLKLIFQVEDINASEFQMTNNFNLLDSVPDAIGAKLIGKTCYKGRNSYLLEYDINNQFNRLPTKSIFKFNGYQLIDVETGFYSYGKYQINWNIDFGETLDSGEDKLVLLDDETFYFDFSKILGFNCDQDSFIENDNDKLINKLKRLKLMFEKELITQDEYDAKRKEILDAM